MVDFFQNHPFWAWASLAVIFLIAELLTMTTYLLLLGIAAAINSLIILMLPNLPLWASVTIFAILSILSVIIGRKFFNPHAKSHNESLNSPNHRLLNQEAVANEDFVNGIGALQIGDTRWRATSKVDIKKGDRVKIHAIDGVTLDVIKL